MSMGQETKIRARDNDKLALKVTKGHFSSDRFHINYYIDMTTLKMRQEEAEQVAKSMVKRYVNRVDLSGLIGVGAEELKHYSKAFASKTPIDTIICMDGCEVIAAFLAHYLSKSGIMSMNDKSDICVITPEFNTNGQMIFRDNIQPMIWEKNILLLVASATTGKTINRSLECIKYYGGNVVGISAIFSAITEMDGVHIDRIFTSDDVPNYQTHSFKDCPDCQQKRKIDAIVNSYGYSKI